MNRNNDKNFLRWLFYEKIIGTGKLSLKYVFDKMTLAPLQKIIFQKSGNYRILMKLSVFIYQ